MREYLRLPLRFEPLFQRKNLAVCSLTDSIARNLHLLITTAAEENKLDLEYGSPFWESDYDIHLSNDHRRDQIIGALKKQIASHEKRIHQVNVEVNVKQALKPSGQGSELKRRVEIIVQAKLIRSNEPFRFQTGFFIGPLLFD
ncbi:MAG: GPW/gp25 family protein [Bacteroidetes bacterium]|jgi:hypothetical protein|nr:GPW/gp25 family protein [Bacteroidota bacterium]